MANDRRRLYKKTFIALVYAALWILFLTGIYFLVRPTPAPVVIPPKIDPIQVLWSQSFVSGPGLYSAAAKILNPNGEFGASAFDYTFTLYDANGNVLTNKQGISFIWPGESKYIIEGGINLSRAPVRADIIFTNHKWQEVKNFRGVALVARNINLKKSDPGQGFYEATATIANNTAYNLARVHVAAVIFDRAGAPLAVNPTTLENLVSQEARQVRLVWFSTFAGAPDHVEFSVSTNLWDRPELLGQ